MTLPHGIAVLWDQRDLMIDGLLTTIAIAAVSAVLAALLGLGLFGLMIGRGRAVPRIVTGFVDLMRCVPFMLFCYLIYYGLPHVGILIDNLPAGVLSLTLYNAAYIAELLRGAYKALPAETVEAGQAFGFHGWRLLLRVILPPVVLSSIPMLGNQMVQIIKDSAFLIIIAVQELTYAADEIQATYYVPFASFICAVLLYWLLCLGVEGGVRVVLRAAEARR
jgi:polar amino acid transport system permease protein